MSIWRHFCALFGWYRATDNEIREMKNVLASLETSSTGHNQVVFEELIKVESQAATMLTHVSIMAAVTGLFLAAGESIGILEVLLKFGLVVYLVLAILLIRCLMRSELNEHKKADSIVNSQNISVHRNSTDIVRDQFVRSKVAELVFRDRIVRFTLFAVYILTFLLVVTILITIFSATPVAPQTL